MTIPSNKEGWIERFDKRFLLVEFLQGVPVSLPNYYKEKLKQFISQELSLQRQEILGEFEEHINDLGMDSNDEEDLLEYLLGIIKQLKEGGKI